MKAKNAIIIRGPTASGKTELSLKLAEKYPIDIISVDSVMVYKGLDIGSAKPSQDILKKYPHLLIGNKFIKKYYNFLLFFKIFHEFLIIFK